MHTKQMIKKLVSLAVISVLLFTTCKKGDSGPAEVIPSAPSNLTITVVSLSQVNLSWTDNSTDESGFKIERKLSGGTFQTIGSVNKNISNYTDNTGLQAGNEYIYRVYAFNAAGKSLDYSNEITIGNPVIIGNAIVQIKGTSAVGDATILSDGGSSITARGWIWSTSPNPTVNLATKTSDGTSTGRFTSSLTGLSLNTTYYVRPYATNLIGTAYWNVATIKTDPALTVAGGNGQGSAANQLLSASDVFVDATGNVYIADQGNHRIQKWAPGATSGTTVAGGNGSGSANNQLDNPSDVFVDANGNIYIVDQGNNRIQKWAPGATSGTTVAGGNGQGSNANQLNSPAKLCIDASGSIFIADKANHRIQKWSLGATSGTTVLGGNGKGSAANQLSFPDDVFVDGSGNIYVADSDNNRVQKWANGYNLISTAAGGNGRGPGVLQLANPKGVFVDKSGNIFVSDTENHRIQKWISAGVIDLPAAGGNGIGSAGNQLSYPHGLFVDAAGFIYVADTGNNRIQKWGQ